MGLVPKPPPECGQKATTADVRSTIFTDRAAPLRQCVDFSATYIDHPMASALHIRTSSPQVGDSVIPIHRLREEQRWLSMKGTSARQISFGSRYTFRILQTLIVMLVYSGCLVAPPLSHGAELRRDTLVSWDAYLDAARSQSASQTPFLWVDQNPERLQRVRDGEILASSVGKKNPKPVASGLIHDWIGAAFIPDARLRDVLSAVRDYAHYTEFYKPTVVEAKALGTEGSCDKYSMRVVNKETVAETALDSEYQACYLQLDELRWYSTARATRVQEIRHYGRPDEQELPPNQGS